MSYEHRFFASFLMLAALAGAASVCIAAEPLYSGRTIEQWQEVIARLDPKVEHSKEVINGLIALALNDSAPDHVRRRAAVTLGRIGTQARSATSPFGRLAGSKSESLETRVWAARALALLAGDAADATPDLIVMLRDQQVPELYRQVPLEALAMIGTSHPDAIPTLISTLEETVLGRDEIGTLFRAAVIDCIGLVGPDAQAAIPLLVRCLRDSSQPSEIRRRAVAAIGTMKQAAEMAIRPLLESLELDSNEAVRDAAAQSLAHIGPAVLPMLLRYTEHPDAAVRWRVAKSIGEVRPRANSAHDVVLRLLPDPNEHVRITACESLYEIRAKRETYVKQLINLLASPDREVRMRAMRLLLRTGPLTSRDLSQLAELRRDPRSYVRTTVRITLDKLKDAYQADVNE